MEAVARWNYVRISPQKARLVADQVRGLTADHALQILPLINKKAAGLIRKVLESAVANADDLNLELDELYVKSIVVNEGPRMKRMRPTARGRGAPYVHRLAHIEIVVSEADE